MLGRKGNKCLFALGIGGIGLVTAGTFIGLAAARHDVAAISVGSSKLAMVIAISGTALFLISFLAAHRLAPEDELIFTPKVLRDDPIGPFYGKIIGLGYNKEYWIIAIGIIGAATVMAYVGVHHGIAKLFADMSFGSSIAIQAVLGFVIGAACIAGFGFITIGWARIHREACAVEAIVFGILTAGATVAGPCLTHIMGNIAANNAEAMALEAIISISIAGLLLVVEDAIRCALSAGILPEHCIVFEKDGISYERVPIT